jgi:hypothetical protein
MPLCFWLKYLKLRYLTYKYQFGMVIQFDSELDQKGRFRFSGPDIADFKTVGKRIAVF